MIRVLFVCLGNICRSPTAEGVFRALVRREGLQDLIGTDSCGTSDWHIGDPPDGRACEEARKRGISLDDLKARQVCVNDFTDFDYVLGMDKQNMDRLSQLCPPPCRGKVHLLLDFAPALSVREVPDPYYGGDDGFDTVFDMIEAASLGLLEDIRKNRLPLNAS
ncbi:MAG: low molecular weight protein-tyrosine-phosphatase [Rhodospirillales bacterium]